MSVSNVMSISSLPKPSIPVDVKEIEQKAANDALTGQPSPDATEPTPTERGVIDICHGAYEELHRKGVEILESTLAAFGENEQMPRQRDFESAEQHSESSVEEWFFNSKQRLLRLQTDFEVAAVHWRYFRDRNSLHREARYPVNHNLHIALLVLFVLVEAILNSFFLAEANALGIVGGIIVAMFISIASILAGFLAGRYLYPLTSSHVSSERLKAQLGITLWVITILGLHFLVAHYRDLSSTLKNDTLALFGAPSHALHHPLELSVLSIVMFLIGVLLSALAFADGARWDDPFPGYGDVDRRLKLARASLDAGLEDARGEMARRIRLAAVESSKLRLTAEGRLTRLGELVAGVEPLRKLYEESLEKIKDTCRNLLTVYRKKNKYIQGATPSPHYFTTFPEFPNALDLSRTHGLPERHAEARKCVEQVCAWDSEIHRKEVGRLKAGQEYLETFLRGIRTDVEQSPEVLQARQMLGGGGQ